MKTDLAHLAKEARERAGLSEQTAAKRLGVSIERLREIENGKRVTTALLESYLNVCGYGLTCVYNHE
jgi:transcriptional regulator with XRE-family HTH domain